jgi:hypothetical protein
MIAKPSRPTARFGPCPTCSAPIRLRTQGVARGQTHLHKRRTAEGVRVWCPGGLVRDDLSTSPQRPAAPA